MSLAALISYHEAKTGLDASVPFVKQLCTRFGTTYQAEDRNKVILAGFQRLLDRERQLEQELEAMK